MAPSKRTNSRQTRPDAGRSNADLSDDMIAKVGTAVGHVAAIQQDFSPRIAAAVSPDEKQGLQQEAGAAVVQAISDQGLTIDQYNEVVSAAQTDPDLEERILEVANAA
jgi:Domain of unknown function (DUF4168)